MLHGYLPNGCRITSFVSRWISCLPTLNAILNGTSAVLLFTGYLYIRKKNIAAHRLFMLSAFSTSTLFLISYITYHVHVGSVHFPGQGWARSLYYSILVSHTLLAGLTVPLVLFTLTYALRGTFYKHKKIAQWTLPIWLYVSVTGVIVYWILYILYKAHA